VRFMWPLLPEPIPAPNNLAATAGNAQVTLTFTQPSSDHDIKGYFVWSEDSDAMAMGTGTTITVTGLTNGTEYSFRVAAFTEDDISLPSEPSLPVTPRASGPLLPDPIPAPHNLAATAGNAQVTLTFTQPSSDHDVKGYFVWSEDSDAMAMGTETTITVTGLTNGTAYSFRAAAFTEDDISLPSEPSLPVTPRASGKSSESSSGGGCNAGLGTLAFALISVLCAMRMLKKKD
ncbi:MAG: fibronectin type III domain-containing protein, partial [Synergistaceae bacterium]|nr:fibronectin type III domain-containing protein [Synergistaceae bacterium]